MVMVADLWESDIMQCNLMSLDYTFYLC